MTELRKREKLSGKFARARNLDIASVGSRLFSVRPHISNSTTRVISAAIRMRYVYKDAINEMFKIPF
jgi:hypothetical protein